VSRGGYRWYVRRQRRIHVLLSDLAGPDHPVFLGGARVGALLPVAGAEAGNLAVSFLALSYAGVLTVTVVADAEAVPDLPVLRSALQGELDALSARP
jgi:hypothetical protein